MPPTAHAPRCHPVVLLTALLATVLGAMCGPAAATATAGAARTTAPVAQAAHTADAAPVVEAAHTAEADAAPAFTAPAPGCRPLHPADGADEPATPTRHSTSYELLPALFDTRGTGTSSWWPGQCAGAVMSGRAPPAAGPPTPVELSVLLRV